VLSSVFVCLLAEIRKNYSIDFHKIWRKGGTRAADETVRFLTVIGIMLL